MRQAAHMSAVHTDDYGRPSGPCEPCFRRNLFGGLAEPTGPQRACEAEARRILGETEPDEPGTASFCIERLQGAGRMDGAGRVYGFPGTYALAESLAAVLPVLDELEAEARQ